MKECQELASKEGNEKELDFDAKNYVLKEYGMVDADQNILFKGKVSRVVSSIDPILITQLVFSGKLKDLNNEEMLAIFSIFLD